MTLACIDLGTNTFHLLIVEVKAGKFLVKQRIRDYVYLAENGIETIGKDSISRLEKTIKKFKSALHKHKIKKCAIVSTAALRTASNGPDIAKYIEKILGFRVEIIDGLREAELIYKGTKMIHKFGNTCSLIMDIGGGSVEFILVKRNNPIWSKSYPIGVAILKKNFHSKEVVTDHELIQLNEFLTNQLADLTELIIKEKPSVLIGASGTFEVIQLLLTQSIETSKTTTHKISDFLTIYEKLVSTKIEERIKMGVPPIRAELMIVAMALINFIINKGTISKITISPYALKEGVLSEMINI